MSWHLRLGNYVIKHFRRPAPSQELILAAFEEESWPPCIWDPLPPAKGQSGKVRQRVAIRHLHAAQNAPGIRFYCNGTDTIGWGLSRAARLGRYPIGTRLPR
jgi:hypothetical protein